MSDEKGLTLSLQPGEYLISDPALLRGMRVAKAIPMSGSAALLVAPYTPITDKLVDRLRSLGVKTLFAEPIQEKFLEAAAVYAEKMCQVVDGIIRSSLGNVTDIAAAFQHRRSQQRLEQLMRDNLQDVHALFLSDPTEKLVALTRYHTGTARHSVIASFHMMALGRELGWSDDKIVRSAIAVFDHDIGKAKVALETLNWPGKLNNEQWREMRYHPLFGALLLHRPGERPDVLMLVALLHHEWYADVPGKGYGGLTLFEEYLKSSVQLDMKQVISSLSADDLDIVQASSLVDMVSALEERRSYKQELDAVKVLIIMNSDAKLGHFSPVHYAAWHRIYQRQYPNLLPLGRRVALPREKERRVFVPLAAKRVAPLPLLTYYELEKLNFLGPLGNVGMDLERIRRRGGLLLKVVEEMKEAKGLSLDCSSAALEAAGITLLKDRIIPEEAMIELDGWREWLTLEELERSGLLGLAQAHHFDLALLRAEGGIAPDRLLKRGIRLPEQRLSRLGIELLKPWTIRLPASEERLTVADLEKLGVDEARLRQANCFEKIKKVKSIPLKWLAECGLAPSRAEMAKCGIDPIRKVFYDVLVTREISTTRAYFVLLREGDDWKDLQAAQERNELDLIQDHLFNRVGEVVMDFADLVALPDLSHLRMGPHWGAHAAQT
ncbi:MAG: hypothetical protein HQL88_09470 [Magnetococcales bacterium]|nr:hypothetical protein [Magnetococcales bacterium]